MSNRGLAARMLAPVALVSCVGAIALVIETTRNGGKPPAPAVPGFGRPAAPPAAGPRTYVVRAGDVLSDIARRAGISLAQLQQLNPGLDPQALSPGQRLRLR